MKKVPAIIASFILAAHFMRAESSILVIACLLMPAILFIKTRPALRTMQVFLIIGTLEWIRTIVVLAQSRIQAGEDWLRMAIILGTVTLFTLLGALLLQSRNVLEKYPKTKSPEHE